MSTHYWIHFLDDDGHIRPGTEHNMSIPGDRYKSRETLIRYGIRPRLNGRTARVEVVNGNKYGTPSATFTVQP